MTINTKKLYRSPSDKFIGGVCGGVGEYLNVDSTIIRILWLLLIFFGGTGILLYIVSLIIIPVNPNEDSGADENTPSRKSINIGLIFGSVFIIIGLLILFHNLGFIPHHFWHIKWDIFFAICLIMAGVFLFQHNPGKKYNDFNSDEDSGSNTRSFSSYHNALFRSASDKKIFGVCGGIGEYFNIDPSIVRVAWVFCIFATTGLALLLYIILGLILPEKKFAKS